MAVHWPAVAALLGGTHEMRKAGKSLLPQWPAEEDDAYKLRLATATLFPALRRTLDVMSGKPFSKELTLGEDVPELIAQWCQDADRMGSSLHVVAAGLMREALGFGYCGLLVDMAVRPAGISNDMAAESAAGLRPYVVPYHHNEILGWRSEAVGGRHVLTQLRLLESAEVPDGDYGTKTVSRVRVLEPGTWALYELDGGGNYVEIDGGATTLREIPFVPFYGRKLGFMRGVSPLLDLAHLNIKHWQSQSDQDTIMHVARVPILAVSGADDGLALTVGGSSAVHLPLGGDMKFVEHSGSAIAAGATSIDALERQMIQTGAELLTRQPGQRTATEAANDADANRSELQSIVESFEDGIDQVLQFMADWAGLGEGGHCALFKDWGAFSLTDASAQLLLAMNGAGIITKETVIREQQRRGILSPDIDAGTELALVADEGPALGGNGGQ